MLQCILTADMYKQRPASCQTRKPS